MASSATREKAQVTGLPVMALKDEGLFVALKLKLYFKNVKCVFETWSRW